MRNQFLCKWYLTFFCLFGKINCIGVDQLYEIIHLGTQSHQKPKKGKVAQSKFVVIAYVVVQHGGYSAVLVLKHVIVCF